MGKKKSSTSEEEANVENEVEDLHEDLFLDDDDDDDENDSESDASDESSPKSKKRVADGDDTSATKRKKFKSDKDLFKQPTVEELNQLRETETLFHSNLFRLQIEEVLNATRLKDKYKKLFEAWLVKFKKSILSIDESEELTLKSAETALHGIKVPRPNIPADKKGVFKFSKPSDIRVIGSYSLGCTTGPDVVIDVMTEMPAKFFRKLDYQNYRYARKRALYLSWLSVNFDQELAASKDFAGNAWTPLLRIIPCGPLGKRVTIHVHLAAEEGSFKLSRFLPHKNSVRPGWYTRDGKVTEGESLLPTPHYNANILRDLVMAQTNARSAKIVGEYPNMRDGIILLKIWLRQRQVNVSHDSFNNHIVTMYVLYLLLEKKLNTFMSSYQIVRNVWINLALSNWSEKGVSMCPETESRVNDYHKYYDCVFLDTSGYHNIAAHLSVDTYRWIRSAAERAVKSLDDPNLDSFQALFMRPVPFYRAFDNLICFNDRSVIEKVVEDQSALNEKLDYGPDRRAQAIKRICAVLKEGLGKRISHLYVRSEKQNVWNVTESAPEDIGRIMIGLSLDPEHCFNIIDKGPHANLEEAAVFRKFWGNKSELRRFQDGSICEALVWAKGKKTLSVKRTICKKIVRFLLKEKFDISKEQYEYVADETDEFLQLKKIRGTKFAYGTGEEATLQVLRVFDGLEKELTSLADLPLSISGVEGYSPVFRYTDVFPPLAGLDDSSERSIVTRPGNIYAMLKETTSSVVHLPKYVPKIDVSLQLSMSGKWPDELEAVRKTKAAFHIQIAECLRNQSNLQAQANSGWVDVFKEGFVFRLEIAHQKEIALAKREIGEDRVEKYRANEESMELEKRLFHLPKLSSALHGLHSQQPSFGPACCLAKRWLSAHLLDESHMPGVIVELLVASIYLTPDPYKSPQTPQVAFLRFLEFFARRHWSTEPIFVNFNNEMTREEIVAVENSFRAAGDSRPSVFISTPYDHDQSIWSQKAPTTLILNRVGSLAVRALKLVDEQLDEAAASLSFRSLFRAPYTEYDCLIRLHSSLLPRRWQFHDLPDKYPVVDLHKIDENAGKKIPVADFDPVQRYLRELRAGYDEIALFFHDTYGGSVIGVLLKPLALEPREFKIANLPCRKLNDGGKLVVDVAAMIEGFTILGKGLVKCIDLQSKRVEFD